MNKVKNIRLPIKQSFFFGSGIFFGALAIFAGQKAYFNIDLEVTRIVQSLNFSFFDILMRFVTEIGNPLLGSAIALFTYFILIALKKYKEFAGLFISTTGALLISNIFKSLVSRQRPDPSLISQIDIYLRADSFPSGHVLFFIGFFGFLAFLLLSAKNLIGNVYAFFCILLIILIGISRIYVGAHWFSDCLGSYLIGFVWLYISVLIYKKL